MTQNTVLTIEDQPDIRRLIRMTLEFKGFSVLEAADGAHGLALARSARPDLILLDVMMPGLSGLSVASTLAADPALCRIPVVMISALGTSGDVDAGLGTGVRAYLVKPFGPVALLELVARLIAEAASSSVTAGKGEITATPARALPVAARQALTCPARPSPHELP